MNCTWVKMLRGILVGPGQPPPQGQFAVPVTLNRREVDVPIDTGCGRTLVKNAKGTFTGEILHMKCIHGDVKEYRTKWEELTIGNQLYHCKVGVVPHLDCAVLIGRDCPLLPNLLKGRTAIWKDPLTGGLQADNLGPGLPVSREDVAYMTEADPSLRSSRDSMRDQPRSH